MAATLRTIVDEATQMIGEVAGVGVQQFDDDVLRNHAIRAFDLLFKKYHWPQFREWRTVILDGLTGIITTDAFEDVQDFEDFIAVHRAGQISALPTLSKSTNPSTVKGTSARAWTSLRTTHAKFATRKLLVYPLLSVGSLDVAVRLYPIVPTATSPALTWDWNDEMHLDKNMLVYATAFMALAGNSLNPEGATTCKDLMQMTYDNITNGLANQPIAVEGGFDIPNTWMEAP